MSEADYIRGYRAAWTAVLNEAIGRLGPHTPSVARLTAQLEQARAMLRIVCAEFGDNDWSDDLHLADVIEKHLYRHLK